MNWAMVGNQGTIHVSNDGTKFINTKWGDRKQGMSPINGKFLPPVPKKIAGRNVKTSWKCFLGMHWGEVEYFLGKESRATYAVHAGTRRRKMNRRIAFFASKQQSVNLYKGEQFWPWHSPHGPSLAAWVQAMCRTLPVESCPAPGSCAPETTSAHESCWQKLE